MELSGSKNFTIQSSSALQSIEEEFIIKQTLLTHNPDGRRVDCKLFFQAMENVMFYATNHSDDAADLHTSDAFVVPDIEDSGSNETLGHVIYKISRAMPCVCYECVDVHKNTLELLEMLGHYTLDAKVTIVLAALAKNYGELWLVLQLYTHNSLAASIALLKNLSWKNLEASSPRFKALERVIKEMVEMAKCVIRFEGLPLRPVLYDEQDSTSLAAAKSQIYLATYWIFRSSLACASEITDLIALKQEKLNMTTSRAWGLSSLALKLNSLCGGLRRQVDASQEQIERMLNKKLMDHLKDHTQAADNQEVLHVLFSLIDDLPLKHCSSSEAKVGISKLKDKVVMLLISKPELLPIDQTLLLVQQTQGHPDHKQDYEILWVPISSSEMWIVDEHRSFEYLTNTLPWFSVRQPWLLNSAVVNIIREEWKFREEALMVVLDSHGVLTNYNATDMVLIWGGKAFPFSTTREEELWEKENWSLQLMVDRIDPLLMKMVEEGKNVCICGSGSPDWIGVFSSRIKEITNAGLQLQVIYVGNRNSSENLRNTLAIVNKGSSFTPTKIRFFWLRLESMRSSILRLGQKMSNYESLLKDVSELLDTNDHEDHSNWAVFGCGKSKDLVKLQGSKIMECFDLFPVWAENVAKLGLVGAMKNADSELPTVNSTAPCDHSKMVPYDEGMIQDTVACDKCKRPMKQYIVYA